MKKLLVASFFLFLLSSCAKNKTVPSAFSYNYNGAQVSGDVYTAYYHRDTTAHLWLFTARYYAGTPSDSNFIQLNFTSTNYIVPNTYVFGTSYANSTTTGMALRVGTANYVETAGSIQITSIDTAHQQITGNFQFNATNGANSYQTASITNGALNNINYQVQ
jgi:hypothetical protein